MTARAVRIAGFIALIALSFGIPAAGLDPSFGTNGKVVLDGGLPDLPRGLVVQPDGSIAAADTYFGQAGNRPAIVRVDASGQLDASFGSSGWVRFNDAFAYANVLARAPDGSLYFAGGYDQFTQGCCSGPTSHPFLRKASVGGLPDDAFNANLSSVLAGYLDRSTQGILAVDVQGDGKVLALEEKHILRFDPDGTLDLAIDPVAQGATLSDDGTVGHGILAQPDGSILVGRFTGHSVGFVRFAADGSTVNQGAAEWQCNCLAWGPDPAGYPIFIGGFIAQQSDGKILVAGSQIENDGSEITHTLGIMRFKPDGAVDTTYGSNGAAVVTTPGTVRGIAIDPNGKAIALTSALEVFRFTTDGQPDTTFGSGGRFTVYAGLREDGRSVAVQGDGKIVVLGVADRPRDAGGGSDANVVIARIDPLITAPITANPTSIDFGAQSAFTVSDTVSVSVTNTSGSATSVSSVSASPGYIASSTCASLAPGASCTIDVAAAPDGNTVGTSLGELAITAGGIEVSVELRSNIEASFVEHFYRAILHRPSDFGGKSYWQYYADALGHSYGVRQEAWYAMALQFFGSAEYTNQNRTSGEFLDDLYETFFARPGDGAGLAYWQAELDAGLTREMVLTAFEFSPEFMQMTAKMQGLQVGDPPNRAETNLVMDFYRGILARLPDQAGLDFYLQQMRTAQCQGAEVVRVVADQASRGFFSSAEYGNRARSDAQYLGDLYNAIMRRGPDVAGEQFWLGQLQAGAITREGLRQVFIASPEFTNRVDAVIAQGCSL